jgi:hypothetical protein
MPAKHAAGNQGTEGDPPDREASRQTSRRSNPRRGRQTSRRTAARDAGSHTQVIESRIRRLQQELEDVVQSRPWGPALGFTAAWLGIIVVFVGLVTRNDLVTVAGVVAMLALIPAFIGIAARRRQEARVRAEIELQERRLAAEIPERSAADRLLETHLDHLDRHFRLVAEHADRGFLVAVGTAALGFLLVVVGLVLGFRGGEPGRDLAWVGAAAGLGMQAVAAALFLVYARSLGHLRSFQDRLARRQDTLLAFSQAAALSDGEDRDRVLAGLIASVVTADQEAGETEGRDVLGLIRRASS